MQIPGLSFTKSYGATGYWRTTWRGFDNVTRFKNEMDGPLFDASQAVVPICTAPLDSISTIEATFGSGNLIMFHSGTRSVVNALPTPTVTHNASQYGSSSAHSYSLATHSFSTIQNTNPITIMAFVKVNAANTASEQVVCGLYGTTTSQNFIELYMTHDGAGHRPAFRWGTPSSPSGPVDDISGGTTSDDRYPGSDYLTEFPGYVHLAAVIDGTSARLYVNGALVSTYDLGGSFTQTMGARTISVGARRIGSTVTLASQASICYFSVYGALLDRPQIASISRCGLRSADCEMQTDVDVVPFPNPFDRQAQGVVVANANKMTRMPMTEYGSFADEIRDNGSVGFTVVMDIASVNIAAMTTGQRHTLFDMMSDQVTGGGGGGGPGGGPGSSGTAYSWGHVYLYKLNSTTVWLEARWGSQGSGTPTNSTLISTSSFTDLKRGHIAVVFGTNANSPSTTRIYVNGKQVYAHPVLTGVDVGLGDFDATTPAWHEPFGLSHTESGAGSTDISPRVKSGPFAFFPSRLTATQVNKLFRVWRGVRGNRHRFNHRLPRRYFQYHGPTRQV